MYILQMESILRTPDIFAFIIEKTCAEPSDPVCKPVDVFFGVALQWRVATQAALDRMTTRRRARVVHLAAAATTTQQSSLHNAIILATRLLVNANRALLLCLLKRMRHVVGSGLTFRAFVVDVCENVAWCVGFDSDAELGEAVFDFFMRGMMTTGVCMSPQRLQRLLEAYLSNGHIFGALRLCNVTMVSQYAISAFGCALLRAMEHTPFPLGTASLEMLSRQQMGFEHAARVFVTMANHEWHSCPTEPWRVYCENNSVAWNQSVHIMRGLLLLRIAPCGRNAALAIENGTRESLWRLDEAVHDGPLVPRRSLYDLAGALGVHSAGGASDCDVSEFSVPEARALLCHHDPGIELVIALRRRAHTPGALTSLVRVLATLLCQNVQNAVWHPEEWAIATHAAVVRNSAPLLRLLLSRVAISVTSETEIATVTEIATAALRIAGVAARHRRRRLAGVALRWGRAMVRGAVPHAVIDALLECEHASRQGGNASHARSRWRSACAFLCAFDGASAQQDATFSAFRRRCKTGAVYY